MAYKCLECGHIFEDGEQDCWEEGRGEYWGTVCSETMSGCPLCRGEYEETTPCKICGSERLDDELFGGVCEECIDEYRKNFNVCYELSIEEKTEIEINSLLASLFDVSDIEQILKEYIRDKWRDVGCSQFIDEDISWFGEKLAEEVRRMKTAKANRDEVRSNTLAIMLTDAQKEAVEREANESGLTMSSWARMVLAEKINQK